MRKTSNFLAYTPYLGHSPKLFGSLGTSSILPKPQNNLGIAPVYGKIAQNTQKFPDIGYTD